MRGASAPIMLGLFLLGAAGSAGSLALLEVRMRETGSREFAFLQVNLALAWAPMLMAAVVLAVHRLHSASWVCAALAVPWLLFLPNAPYLVTDAVHFGRMWEPAPLWYDAVMLGAFGATGLLLGYASLYVVHTVIAERYGPVVGWGTALVVFTLMSTGIYIGRVLRLNSWDALTQPHVIAGAVAMRAQDPAGNTVLWPLLGTMALLLSMGYVVFVAAGSAARRRAPARHRQRRPGQGV